ncbi:FAD-dependent oxidoreductase [Emticicia agri]|uniref:FAD-dependent oxidoreductase n=1 Tax=Emticicia agri TaxID=2492393 RepID=A0A4Q5M1G6_9BACT|nr:FAD-dependent oxidoreductase [Emticicia agri]RYU96074.1 FAD-dependent oxidoreductase [Emticicia agri]
MKILLFFLFLSGYCMAQIKSVDVCVYGGTSSGVIAAYTAKKYGKTVLLIEPTKRLGGLTSGGLGQTDIGNKYAITGISRDFYRRIGKHYGRFEQWTFEPSVAEKIFQQYMNEANVAVLYEHRLKQAEKRGGKIEKILVENGKSSQWIKAKVFIDATYEGDLMAKAGVSYTIGREANSVYNETWNGVQLLDKHQFPDGVDPYKEVGNPASGLLWGISNEKLAATGSGDKKVQTYNFRLCLTDSIENQIPVTKPASYDASKYELLLRYIEKKQPQELNWALMHIQPMPHRKTDINNSGPFSTDMIGENYDYPEADYDTRQQIQLKHEEYIKGFLYFLGNDKRVPEHLRKEMKKWGYPKDEYTDNNHFSPQMYVREARRMIGEYVMTEHHCEGRQSVSDGIGMAAYTMDSHNCQRIVVNGMVKNEGDVQQGLGGLPPYPISYWSILPKRSECINLLVPVCLSATHIAYGSIRMEPVFMVLGQSAAVAASMAIDANKILHEIDVKKLQLELAVNPLANKNQAEQLIDNDDIRVKLNGNWTIIPKGQERYGKNYLIDETKGEQEKSVIYTPIIPITKKYKIYIYFPRYEQLSKQINVNIWTNSGKKTLLLKPQNTESDWLYVGEFFFERGLKNMLEITNQGADGAVIADAVLFMPEN